MDMKKGDEVLIKHTDHKAIVHSVNARDEIVFVHDLVSDEYVHARFKDTELIKSFEEKKVESSTIVQFQNNAKEMKEKIMGS